MQQEMLIR